MRRHVRFPKWLHALGEKLPSPKHATDDGAVRRLSAGWLLGIWSVFVVAITITESPTPGNVSAIYFRAGADFLSGDPLYDNPYFLYFPTAALFFAPFGWLFTAASFPWLASIWRLINLAVFWAGSYRLARMRWPERSVSFLPVALAVCALSLGAAKHANVTLTIGGLLMFAAASFERSRLWHASFLMALALALKPVVLPFLLLAFAVKPGALWRTSLFAAAFALLPFLFQANDYVLAQYAELPGMLTETVERKDAMLAPSALGVLQAAGADLSQSTRLAVRASFALLTLLVFLAARRSLRQASHRSLLLYGIACAYILLFNPATEGNTYALLAPVLGILWCLSREGEPGETRSREMPRGWLRSVLGLVILAYVFAHSASKVFPEIPMAHMAKPLATGLLVAALASRPVVGWLRRAIPSRAVPSEETT